MAPDEVTLDLALALLALPRTVGVHLGTGETILAGIGRYGAWLKHGRTYVALPEDEDVLNVELNRAVSWSRRGTLEANARNGGVAPAIAGEADDGPPLTPIVGGIAAANSRESTHVGWVVGGGEYPRFFA